MIRAGLANIFPRALLASAALLAAACSGETKDMPATPSGEPIALMHLQAKMRDGVRLDTSVWLPAAEGKFPVRPRASCKVAAEN